MRAQTLPGEKKNKGKDTIKTHNKLIKHHVVFIPIEEKNTK